MDKLEIGMYIRTNYRHEVVIRQIKAMYHSQIEKDTSLIFDKPTKHEYYVEDEKFKANHNLIDLIELGDYVNGYKVESDDFLGKHIVIFEAEERKYKRMYLGRINIDNIVTKEQFENMKYEIGEK